MAFKDTHIYKAAVDMSKGFRRSIRQMPKAEKFCIGERMLLLLNDIKYQIYLSNTARSEERLKNIRELLNMLAHLKICIEDCVEDGTLSLKDKFSIQLPLKSLNDAIKQAKSWERYTKDTCDGVNKIDKSDNVKIAEKVFEKKNKNSLK